MEIDKCGKSNPKGVELFLLRYYFKNAIYGRAEYSIKMFADTIYLQYNAPH